MKRMISGSLLPQSHVVHAIIKTLMDTDKTFIMSKTHRFACNNSRIIRVHKYLFSYLSFFFLSVIIPSECFAKEIHVPGDYSTIQEAIYFAIPGDTVRVAAGKYRENIRMRKGIKLIGAGAGKSGIKPVNNKTKSPIVVTADQCLLEGFTFLGSTKAAPAAILIEDGSPTIRNNVIKKNQNSGILIKYAKANPLIERNRIYKNNKAGIKAFSCGGRIIANEIFENLGSGISLIDAYSVIEGNYIYNNKNTGITAGVGQILKQSEETRQPFIHKNKIEYNKGGGIVAEHRSLSIIANTISNKSKPAILLFSSNSVIKNNIIVSGGPPAIRINGPSSPIVEDNVISGSLRFPIMNDSRTARIRNNVIKTTWTPAMPLPSK